MNLVIKKSAAAIVVFLFLFNQIADAQTLQLISSRSELPSVTTLKLPADLGEIQESYPASNSSNPVIIQIQTAHANHDASEKISSIVGFLKEKVGVNVLIAEGGEGKLDPQRLRFFSDRKINRAYLSELSKAADVTAADLTLWDSGIPGYGAENTALYLRAFSDFKSVASSRSENELSLDAALARLDRAASRQISPAFHELIKTYAAYEKNQRDFGSVVGFLKKSAQFYLSLDLKNPFNQYEWPMLVRVSLLSELEKKVNPERAAKDRDRLLSWMRINNINSELFTAIEASKDAGREAYQSFLSVARPKGFRFRDYRDLTYSLAYHVISGELDASKLMNEVELLFRILVRVHAKKSSEIKIWQAFRQVTLIQKLMRLELTRDEWKRVEKQALWKQFLQLKNMKEALDFYWVNEKRERSFYDQAVLRLRESHHKNAVMITGGFHADGVKAQALKNGLGYVSILPHIADLGDRNLYMKAMLRQAMRLPASDLRVSVAANQLELAARSNAGDFVPLVLSPHVSASEFSQAKTSSPSANKITAPRSSLVFGVLARVLLMFSFMGLTSCANLMRTLEREMEHQAAIRGNAITPDFTRSFITPYYPPVPNFYPTTTSSSHSSGHSRRSELRTTPIDTDEITALVKLIRSIVHDGVISASDLERVTDPLSGKGSFKDKSPDEQIDEAILVVNSWLDGNDDPKKRLPRRIITGPSALPTRDRLETEVIGSLVQMKSRSESRTRTKETKVPEAFWSGGRRGSAAKKVWMRDGAPWERRSTSNLTGRRNRSESRQVQGHEVHDLKSPDGKMEMETSRFGAAGLSLKVKGGPKGERNLIWQRGSGNVVVQESGLAEPGGMPFMDDNGRTVNGVMATLDGRAVNVMDSPLTRPTPDGVHKLHGASSHMPWETVSSSDDSVTYATTTGDIKLGVDGAATMADIKGDVAYQQSHSVANGVYTSSLNVENRGNKTAVLGGGYHPFYQLEDLEDWTIQFPAYGVWATDSIPLPLDAKMQSINAGSKLDYITPQPLRYGTEITFGNLRRNDDGDVVVIFRNKITREQIEIKFKEYQFSTLLLWVPPKEGAPAPGVFSVEPLFTPPNGRNMYMSGNKEVHPIVAEPNKSQTFEWSLKYIPQGSTYRIGSTVFFNPENAANVAGDVHNTHNPAAKHPQLQTAANALAAGVNLSGVGPVTTTSVYDANSSEFKYFIFTVSHKNQFYFYRWSPQHPDKVDLAHRYEVPVDQYQDLQTLVPSLTKPVFSFKYGHGKRSTFYKIAVVDLLKSDAAKRPVGAHLATDFLDEDFIQRYAQTDPSLYAAAVEAYVLNAFGRKDILDRDPAILYSAFNFTLVGRSGNKISIQRVADGNYSFVVQMRKVRGGPLSEVMRGSVTLNRSELRNEVEFWSKLIAVKGQDARVGELDLNFLKDDARIGGQGMEGYVENATLAQRGWRIRITQDVETKYLKFEVWLMKSPASGDVQQRFSFAYDPGAASQSRQNPYPFLVNDIIGDKSFNYVSRGIPVRKILYDPQTNSMTVLLSADAHKKLKAAQADLLSMSNLEFVSENDYQIKKISEVGSRPVVYQFVRRSESRAPIIQRLVRFVIFGFMALMSQMGDAIAAGFGVPNLPTIVYTQSGDRKIYVRERNPDGSLGAAYSAFFHGVNWGPHAPGIDPLSNPSAYSQKVFDLYQRDIPLMAKMGVNLVRPYYDFGISPQATNVLNTFYKYGIKVIMPTDAPNFGNVANSTNIPIVVNGYKNHPAVLMWGVGNEWDINGYYNRYPDIQSAASFTEASALTIKGLDLSHPVATFIADPHIPYNSSVWHHYLSPEIAPWAVGRGDAFTSVMVNDWARDIDVWGLQIYRGASFTDVFTQWRSISSKPMMITEFGADSMEHVVDVNFNETWSENQGMQRNFDLGLFDELTYNSIYRTNGTASGGLVFEWSDEWWKNGNGSSHDISFEHNGGQPDDRLDEEWFGLVDINGTPKLSYFGLQGRFSLNGSYQTTTVSNPVLRVTSAGSVKFEINGRTVFSRGGGDSGARGLNILILDETNGFRVKDYQHFDTWLHQNELSYMQTVVSYLNSIPNGSIIMIGVADNSGLWNPGPSTPLWQALEGLGSTLIRDTESLRYWAFITKKGVGKFAETNSFNPISSTVTLTGVDPNANRLSPLIIPNQPVIEGLKNSNGNFEITFKTQPNLVYEIEYSNDLSPGSWEVAQRGLVADGTSMKWTDDGSFTSGIVPVQNGSLPARRFYRIVPIDQISRSEARRSQIPFPENLTPSLLYRTLLTRAIDAGNIAKKSPKVAGVMGSAVEVLAKLEAETHDETKFNAAAFDRNFMNGEFHNMFTAEIQYIHEVAMNLYGPEVGDAVALAVRKLARKEFEAFLKNPGDTNIALRDQIQVARRSGAPTSGGLLAALMESLTSGGIGFGAAMSVPLMLATDGRGNLFLVKVQRSEARSFSEKLNAQFVAPAIFWGAVSAVALTVGSPLLGWGAVAFSFWNVVLFVQPMFMTSKRIAEENAFFEKYGYTNFGYEPEGALGHAEGGAEDYKGWFYGMTPFVVGILGLFIFKSFVGATGVMLLTFLAEFMFENLASMILRVFVYQTLERTWDIFRFLTHSGAYHLNAAEAQAANTVIQHFAERAKNLQQGGILVVLGNPTPDYPTQVVQLIRQVHPQAILIVGNGSFKDGEQKDEAEYVRLRRQILELGTDIPKLEQRILTGSEDRSMHTGQNVEVVAEILARERERFKASGVAMDKILLTQMPAGMLVSRRIFEHQWQANAAKNNIGDIQPAFLSYAAAQPVVTAGKPLSKEAADLLRFIVLGAAGDGKGQDWRLKEWHKGDNPAIKYHAEDQLSGKTLDLVRDLLARSESRDPKVLRTSDISTALVALGLARFTQFQISGKSPNWKVDILGRKNAIEPLDKLAADLKARLQPGKAGVVSVTVESGGLKVSQARSELREGVAFTDDSAVFPITDATIRNDLVSLNLSSYFDFRVSGYGPVYYVEFFDNRVSAAARDTIAKKLGVLLQSFGSASSVKIENTWNPFGLKITVQRSESRVAGMNEIPGWLMRPLDRVFLLAVAGSGLILIPLALAAGLVVKVTRGFIDRRSAISSARMAIVSALPGNPKRSEDRISEAKIDEYVAGVYQGFRPAFRLLLEQIDVVVPNRGAMTWYPDAMKYRVPTLVVKVLPGLIFEIGVSEGRDFASIRVHSSFGLNFIREETVNIDDAKLRFLGEQAIDAVRQHLQLIQHDDLNLDQLKALAATPMWTEGSFSGEYSYLARGLNVYDRNPDYVFRGQSPSSFQVTVSVPQGNFGTSLADNFGRLLTLKYPNYSFRVFRPSGAYTRVGEGNYAWTIQFTRSRSENRTVKDLLEERFGGLANIVSVNNHGLRDLADPDVLNEQILDPNDDKYYDVVTLVAPGEEITADKVFAAINGQLNEDFDNDTYSYQVAVSNAIRLFTFHFNKIDEGAREEISRRLIAAYEKYYPKEINYRFVGKMGGTSIQWAIATPMGLVAVSKSYPTHVDAAGKSYEGELTADIKALPGNQLITILTRIASGISDLSKTYQLKNKPSDYFFAAPGFFGEDGKLAEPQQNIANMPAGFHFDKPNLTGLSLPQILKSVFGLDLNGETVHDATGHALGEKSVYGAYHGKNDYYTFVVGTGIATRWMRNGKSFTGGARVNGLHNEIPHALVSSLVSKQFSRFLMLETEGRHRDMQGERYRDTKDLEDLVGGKAVRDRIQDQYEQIVSNSAHADNSAALELKSLIEQFGGQEQRVNGAVIGRAYAVGNKLVKGIVLDAALTLGKGIAASLFYSNLHWPDAFPRVDQIPVVVGGVLAKDDQMLQAIRDGARDAFENYFAVNQKADFVDSMIQRSSLPDNVREFLGGLPVQQARSESRMVAPAVAQFPAKTKSAPATARNIVQLPVKDLPVPAVELPFTGSADRKLSALQATVIGSAGTVSLQPDQALTSAQLSALLSGDTKWRRLQQALTILRNRIMGDVHSVTGPRLLQVYSPLMKNESASDLHKQLSDMPDGSVVVEYALPGEQTSPLSAAIRGLEAKLRYERVVVSTQPSILMIDRVRLKYGFESAHSGWLTSSIPDGDVKGMIVMVNRKGSRAAGSGSVLLDAAVTALEIGDVAGISRHFHGAFHFQKGFFELNLEQLVDALLANEAMSTSA